MQNKIYFSTAFSLSMISSNCSLEIKEINLKEVKEIIGNNFIDFRIGHQSTAQVLKEMLDIVVTPDRTPIKLNYGDGLIVFQLMKRPNEGQVYTNEEIKEIVEKGLYKFYYVLVKPPQIIAVNLEDFIKEVNNEQN